MSLPRPLQHVASEFFGSAPFVHALTIAIVGAGAGAFALRALIGWPGYLGIVITLVVLASASLIARRDRLKWHGILPVSLLTFLAWSALSVLWTDYQWITAGSIGYQICFALLGVYIVLNRDAIQIVRAFGDALRAVLMASLLVEFLAGVLIDSPLPFLGVRGALAGGGPIQGLAGERNQLGIIAVVAGITFAVEFLTRSTARVTAAASMSLALLVILLTQSPIVFLTAAVAIAAGLVLFGIRRARPETRQPITWALLLAGTVGVAVFASGLFRGGFLAPLLSDDFGYRSSVWRQVRTLIGYNNLEGWGWVGLWRSDIAPYFAIRGSGGRPQAAALSSFLDIWLQVGLVGVAIFCGLAVLAVARSWLLATRRGTVVYLWPAVTLAALLAYGVVESTLLVEFGWLVFVVCVVLSAQKLSWRVAFERAPEPPENLG